jgi:hypothetical protein
MKEVPDDIRGGKIDYRKNGMVVITTTSTPPRN